MSEVAEKIRRICARMIEEPPESARWARYHSELKAATEELAAEQNEWNKHSESDVHQDEARQAYRSREKDAAEGFAKGLKLFQTTKRDSEKKKD